jgi:hypothetical protein
MSNIEIDIYDDAFIRSFASLTDVEIEQTKNNISRLVLTRHHFAKLYSRATTECDREEAIEQIKRCDTEIKLILKIK